MCICDFCFTTVTCLELFSLLCSYLSHKKGGIAAFSFLPEGHHWARLSRSLGHKCGIKVGLQVCFVLWLLWCSRLLGLSCVITSPVLTTVKLKTKHENCC